MNWLFSWSVSLLVTLPIAFRLLEFAGKPVDLVGSDLLFLLLIFVPRRRDLEIPRGLSLWRLWVVRIAASATLLYNGVMVSLVYAETSDMSRVASAVKFAKPLAFVLLGTYLAAVTSPIGMLRRIALAFAGMSVATFVTAVSTPGFPHVAWGQSLFGFPTYGYPNSAMTLFAIMIPLLLATADRLSSKPGRWILRGIACLTGMTVLVSLSRSSTATMACGVLIYLYLTGRLYLPLFVAFFSVVLLVMFSGVFDFITQNNHVAQWVERLSQRFSQTVDSSDPLSGRGDIWELTIELWAERPFFGYAFESFSNYADFDTPHQQYLEILYKSGAVGAALYGAVLLTSLLGLFHLARFAVPRSEPWFLLRALIAALCATLVGNLSQPNLTYSVTGNFLFFALGLSLNKHAAAALVIRSRPFARLPQRRVTAAVRGARAA